MDESPVPTQNDDKIEQFGFRDGHLFVIDVAPEMFELDPKSGSTYFIQCLHTYGRILSQKLMWNRRDWMGLMVYNATKNWDRDPETEQIVVVQKFAEVEANMLTELMHICNHKASSDNYCDPKSDIPLDKCLHDVLWQASRSFDAIKMAMPVRQVVLLTRRDNPLSDDAEERHKIRLRAKTYRDIKVNLKVVRLGESWNHELFYKDIDVLANNTEPEDSKPTTLDELEVQVRFPARTSGHLKWRIGNDVEIPIFLTSFSSKTKFLKKSRMQKDTNEILEVHRHWGTTRQFGDDSEDEGDQDIVKTQIPDYVRKAVTCGDRTVSFRYQEVRNIRLSSESGINLIGFKPISLDLIYSIKATRFAGIERSASQEAKSLFAALLSKCEAKNVMAICAVTHRSAPYLAKMIPCRQYGGFYVCKIAFREQINRLEEYTKQYIYDTDDKGSLPFDDEGVNIMKKIVKKVRTNWDPLRFNNPKLNRQLSYIETLALDTEGSEPQDSTRPDKAQIAARLDALVVKFENKFGKPMENAIKRGASGRSSGSDKVQKFDDQVIRDLIKNNMLQETTVATLKSMARSIGVQCTGLKVHLVERITAHYEKKNVS